MIEFEPGHMIVLPNGQIGMIDMADNDKATIKLGTDGPYRVVWIKSLRFATSEELKAVDLDGVGHRASPAVP